MIDFSISERLKLAVSFIEKGRKVADIGTDHGYLPIHLIREGVSCEVIAADMRKNPLEKAKKNAESYMVADKISFRLSDGLSSFDKGEVNAYVICGMGGTVIKKILQKALAEDKLNVGDQFVLSPQADREMFRKFLYENGFLIKEEKMIRENSWFYVVFSCIYDGHPREEEELFYRYGRKPIEEKQEALREFLIHEREVLERVKSKLDSLGEDVSLEKKEGILSDLDINKKALESF